MRRPLDWVLSISMMVLVANHVLTDSDTARMASVPVTSVPVTAAPVVDTALEESPFAWIREDGTQVYLPSPGPSTETRAAPTEAVFTWTLPMVTPGREARAFQ